MLLPVLVLLTGVALLLLVLASDARSEQGEDLYHGGK